MLVCETVALPLNSSGLDVRQRVSPVKTWLAMGSNSTLLVAEVFCHKVTFSLLWPPLYIDGVVGRRRRRWAISPVF